MVDTCIIRRRTGLATDPVTGKVTPTYITVYPTAADVEAGNNGKCKIQTFTNRELLHTGGEHQFIVQRYEVHVPVSTVGIQANDEVLVTASVHDPDLINRSYRVVALMNKSMATARRLGVEEMVA